MTEGIAGTLLIAGMVSIVVGLWWWVPATAMVVSGVFLIILAFAVNTKPK